MALGAVLIAGAHVAWAEDAVITSPSARTEAQKLAQEPPVHPPNHIAIDHSGRREVGKASFYARQFDGHKTANGERFDPNSNTAASKSLPLGTRARVTNLNTGQTTVVQVKDRGPFVHGRVVDLAPKAAAQIGIGPKEGVAPVSVAPIAVPQPDGSVKAGAGAVDPSPQVTASQ